jgi:hypothetical protein
MVSVNMILIESGYVKMDMLKWLVIIGVMLKLFRIKGEWLIVLI